MVITYNPKRYTYTLTTPVSGGGGSWSSSVANYDSGEDDEDDEDEGLGVSEIDYEYGERDKFGRVFQYVKTTAKEAINTPFFKGKPVMHSKILAAEDEDLTPKQQRYQNLQKEKKHALRVAARPFPASFKQSHIDAMKQDSADHLARIDRDIAEMDVERAKIVSDKKAGKKAGEKAGVKIKKTDNDIKVKPKATARKKKTKTKQQIYIENRSKEFEAAFAAEAEQKRKDDARMNDAIKKKQAAKHPVVHTKPNNGGKNNSRTGKK